MSAGDPGELEMMARCHLLMGLCLLSSGAFATDRVVYWREYSFKETSALAQLPASIVQQLQSHDGGAGGVAEKTGPFNATDVVEQAGPTRRLLAAGRSGDTWLVAVEQGGRGYNIQVFLFAAGVKQEQWTMAGWPTPVTLNDVLERLPVTNACACRDRNARSWDGNVVSRFIRVNPHDALCRHHAGMWSACRTPVPAIVVFNPGW